ncbi:MAG TPA: LytTR family DNA-binding domain-containing protein [Candidatus Binatia bacterium]|nr:LytTR family DNA-binding domain-containing protein [Candidatus Binatia bacterium]
MAAIRTLVVDDEELARARLVGFLAGGDGISLVGEAADGVAALRMIEEQRPDLVFLDVQMPGMDGFEVLKALRPPLPQVVFSTAYDEYAIRAFEVGAVDYLLKPYARARVEESIARVRTRMGNERNGPDWDGLLRRLDERRTVHVSQVPVHSGKRILIVPVGDVLWFGVEYRLVYAHTAERAFMTNYTLRELEERLDPAVFFRAHKSSLVNLRHVKEIVPWFGGRYKLVMRDASGSEVALSRAQARELRARLRW